MFYAHFVLSKKGPLAKVWLAAHWDKKLTKAHVFETDVEATVDNIISPKVKMALRTSGHLLLGVVRIYSRKQKYLIQDLGEACAKIKMAFRPGIVERPLEGTTANAETITLPEIFHDFETAVADLNVLDMDEQFTLQREAITMAEDIPTGDAMFALDNDFNEPFNETDFEIPRASNTLHDESQLSTSRLQLPKSGNKDESLMEVDGHEKHTLEEMRHPGLELNEFGGEFADGFGPEGLQNDLLDNIALPELEDLHRPANGQPEKDGNEEMEVDPPRDPEQPHPALHDGGPANLPHDTSEFALDPIDTSGLTRPKQKRKRKLVIDTRKELTSMMIRSNLADTSDILQTKCFPPPTKKALIWKDTANCEQLFSRPAVQFMAPEIGQLITRNFTSKLPEEETAVEQSMIELDPDIEIPRGKEAAINESAVSGVNAAPHEAAGAKEGDDALMVEHALEPGQPLDMLDLAQQMDPLEEREEPSRVIPTLPDIQEMEEKEEELAPTQEQQSGEASEEFEQRRWTKRTQQVFKMLNHGFEKADSVDFLSLTRRCSRKQAASRFYTCLLLAKEGTIQFQQSEPYGDISIEKGPRFAQAC